MDVKFLPAQVLDLLKKILQVRALRSSLLSRVGRLLSALL